jgi:hypothetical protein
MQRSGREASTPMGVEASPFERFAMYAKHL